MTLLRTSLTAPTTQLSNPATTVAATPITVTSAVLPQPVTAAATAGGTALTAPALNAATPALNPAVSTAAAEALATKATHAGTAAATATVASITTPVNQTNSVAVSAATAAAGAVATPAVSATVPDGVKLPSTDAAFNAAVAKIPTLTTPSLSGTSVVIPTQSTGEVGAVAGLIASSHQNVVTDKLAGVVVSLSTQPITIDPKLPGAQTVPVQAALTGAYHAVVPGATELAQDPKATVKTPEIDKSVTTLAGVFARDGQVGGIVVNGPDGKSTTTPTLNIPTSEVGNLTAVSVQQPARELTVDPKPVTVDVPSQSASAAVAAAAQAAGSITLPTASVPGQTVNVPGTGPVPVTLNTADVVKKDNLVEAGTGNLDTKYNDEGASLQGVLGGRSVESAPVNAAIGGASGLAVLNPYTVSLVGADPKVAVGHLGGTAVVDLPGQVATPAITLNPYADKGTAAPGASASSGQQADAHGGSQVELVGVGTGKPVDLGGVGGG